MAVFRQSYRLQRALTVRNRSGDGADLVRGWSGLGTDLVRRRWGLVLVLFGMRLQKM
ncbi:hypothetical protein [Anaerorudis cellulosivorans]|uniref:hypothetical protein n=1 Tax=Anaerorudis cellulosivorans TaxID=3397862 RepID=UPI00221E8B05|nr:hypothetical protein [Seramator thermalis]MCW1735716.1 hypothetical protein [Seramator thermalis]